MAENVKTNHPEAWYSHSTLCVCVCVCVCVVGLFIYFLFLLFTCAYNVWVISPPYSRPAPSLSLRSLPLPTTPLIPGRNYFALISNFVEERL
jgi:hypothetical protein